MLIPPLFCEGFSACVHFELRASKNFPYNGNGVINLVDAYGNLSELITLARTRAPKGKYRLIPQATDAGIFVVTYDADVMDYRVVCNSLLLKNGGVFLVVCRRTDVLGGTEWQRWPRSSILYGGRHQDVRWRHRSVAAFARRKSRRVQSRPARSRLRTVMVVRQSSTVGRSGFGRLGG